MDLNQRLLAAFQVEHVEHLEAIRAELGKLDGDALRDDGKPVDLEDSFRRAHSLKGAARITGLASIETLMHRLESVLDLLRSGKLALNADTLRIINLTLDALEDYAAALGGPQPPEEPATALAELDRLLAVTSPATPPPSPALSGLQQRLAAAFQEEYQEYVTGMRAVLGKVGSLDAKARAAEFDEGLRCAHSLKGAARAADVGPVELIAQRLEEAFSQLTRRVLAPSDETFAMILRALQGIDHFMTAAPDMRRANDTRQSLAELEQLLGVASAPAAIAPATPATKTVDESDNASVATIETQPAAATPAPETLRLNAENLDRLLQSTGELLTESLQQDLVARDLQALGKQILGLATEWSRVKLSSAGALQQMAASPELGRLANYIEFVDRQTHALNRQVRSLRFGQQRGSWSLRRLARQLQQDVCRVRMVPAENVFHWFRKMIRDLARDEGKEIEFRASGFDTQVDLMVLQALKDPLMHALRNCVVHGIESPAERLQKLKNRAGLVSMKIQTSGNRLLVVVEDDGRGVNLAQVAELATRRGFLSAAEAAKSSAAELMRLLFRSGFSTAGAVTELSGRGIGLSTVYLAASSLQGEADFLPRAGGGTLLRVRVPLSLSTHRLLMVSCAGQTFALPLSGIESLERVKRQNLETIQGRPVLTIDGHVTPLVGLAQLLGIAESSLTVPNNNLLVLVFNTGVRRLAVAVDAVIAEREAVIENLGPPASSVKKYLGGILLEDGGVALVLNPLELTESFHPSNQTVSIKQAAEEKPPPTILVVDDSFTTRTLETSILETCGYRVRVAVDGIEALAKLRAEKVDLVITDIQMPRMDGFGLLEEIKKDPRLARLPVIIVSSLDRREDQERGLHLGADAYIVKRKFDHQDLLQTIQQIL